MKLTFFAAVVVLVWASLIVWLIQREETSTVALLDPSNAALISLGEEVYRAECASCHGENLEGEPNWQTRGDDGLLPAPPHDETGHTWHHPDQILFNITKLGVAAAADLTDYESAMPAYGELLSDEEIIAVLSWIKAQWPEEIQARHDILIERYRNEKGQ